MKVRTVAYCKSCRKNVKIKDWYLDSIRHNSIGIKGNCIYCGKESIRQLSKEELKNERSR